MFDVVYSNSKPIMGKFRSAGSVRNKQEWP